MSDLFHEEMPFELLKSIFDVMIDANWHIYQILTKRPQRMSRFISDYGRSIPENVWIGVSVENSDWKHRIDVLRRISTRIRFVSFEPLLGSIGKIDLEGISWVIVGGESGPNHRLMSAEWVREIREQCVAFNVPFFFKQWGGLRPKSGGRILDGRTWDEYPTTQLKWR
jgi:protein gp37